MEKVEFSRPLPEVGCIVGHLFDGMVPPCEEDHPAGEDWLTVKYADAAAAHFRCANPEHYHMGTGDASNMVVFKGPTKTGRYAELSVMLDRCEFYGDPQELQMILDGKCLDRRCGHG